jgi:methyl-accepting chemotaxis protein
MNIPIDKVLEQPRKVFYTTTMVVGNVALLLLLGVVYLISGGISRPVVEIAGVVNKVATDRDLTLQAPVKTGDEVGLMAKAFNNMTGEC